MNDIEEPGFLKPTRRYRGEPGSAIEGKKEIGSSSASVKCPLPSKKKKEMQLAKTSNVGDSPCAEVEHPPPTKKAHKTLTSEVWNFFTKTGKDEDGVEIATCNACGKTYKCGVKPGVKVGNYGTSHMRRHNCRKIIFHQVDQILMDKDGKLRPKKIEQTTHRGLLAEAIIKHDLPFSFVEYDMLRTWVKYLNPDAIMPTRNTLLSDIHKVHYRERERLMKSMTNISTRICITSDCWTACNQEGYMCVTAHYVSNEWKLQSKIICYSRIDSHTGIDLATSIHECLKEWGIEKKIFSITLDNASSNDVLVRVMKANLSLHNALLCNGDFFHIRCCAHILNLIVQDGLKVASDALHKIRESIKYVKSSDARMRKFKECVQQDGINVGVGLRLDVTTRWNSTYMMLDSVRPYKRAFHSLSMVDLSFKCCPTNDDWLRVERICDFLEPFYETTNLISGSSYPTSNLYFMQIWKIECILLKYYTCEDVVLREMVGDMKRKFDKYWSEYSIILAFGAVLDPRMKLQVLKFCYTRLDPDSSQEKIDLVKSNMYRLFQCYTHNSIHELHPTPTLGTQHAGSISKRSNFFNEFKMYESENTSREGKSELDLYLSESKLDYDYYPDLDVLNYWKEHAKRFPDLSMMARDVLSIPITTVASESAFSIGSRVLSKYRNRILPKHVETLICTRNWLHDFDPLQTDEDESIQSILNPSESSSAKGISGQDSNIITEETN